MGLGWGRHVCYPIDALKASCLKDGIRKACDHLRLCRDVSHKFLPPVMITEKKTKATRQFCLERTSYTSPGQTSKFMWHIRNVFLIECQWRKSTKAIFRSNCAGGARQLQSEQKWRRLRNHWRHLQGAQKNLWEMLKINSLLRHLSISAAVTVSLRKDVRAVDFLLFCPQMFFQHRWQCLAHGRSSVNTWRVNSEQPLKG